MAAIKSWLFFCCCCCGTCRIYCNRLVLSHGIAQFTYRASIHQTGSSSGERNDNSITIICDNWIRAFSHQSPTQSQAHRRRLRGSGGSKREMANHFSQCTFEIGSASGWNENKTARSLSGCANAVLIDLSRKVTSRTKPYGNGPVAGAHVRMGVQGEMIKIENNWLELWCKVTIKLIERKKPAENKES